MQQISASVTQRFQVTLPAKVRRALGIGPCEKVTFQIDGDVVRLLPAAFSVKSVRGTVRPLRGVTSWPETERIAGDEHAQHILDEMQMES